MKIQLEKLRQEKHSLCVNTMVWYMLCVPIGLEDKVYDTSSWFVYPLWCVDLWISHAVADFLDAHNFATFGWSS